MPHVLSDVLFDDGAAKVIHNVLSGGWSLDGNVVYGHNSSNVDPGQYYAGQSAPKANIETADLATVLALSLLNGAKITGGIALPFRKRDDCGSYLGGSNHTASTCTAGLLLVDSIEASQSGESEDSPGAKASLTFHAKGDGTDPIAIATAQAIADEVFGSQFCLGPVYANAALMTGVRSIRLQTQITVDPRFRDGLLFPKELYIIERKPMLTVEFDNLEQTATSGGFGASFSAVTSVVAYLRRRKNQTSFEANAALAHGSISFGAGIAKLDSTNFTQRQDGSGSVTFCAAGLASAVGVAIP